MQTAREEERLQQELVQEHMNKLREEAKANKGNLRSKQETAPEVTGAEEQKERDDVGITPARRDISNELDFESEKKTVSPVPIADSKEFTRAHNLVRSPSDYFPMIKRGGGGPGEESNEDEQEVMAVGWKVEVTNRKEREEALRDEVRRFEIKIKKFYPTLEEGIDVTLWQLNRQADVGKSADDFAMKSTPVTLKLHRRGDLLVQAMLTFNTVGGYLSKALGRKNRDRTALDPLSLNEILEIKAGCVGYDHADLPSASSSKGKKRKVKGDNKHSSLFLTLKAAPTPLASTRLYFLRFKSRSARNDLLTGLRGLLADLQIHEGVSISTIQTPKAAMDAASARKMPNANTAAYQANQAHELRANSNMLVPLSEVHDAIDKEREHYDRLLLMMLQGTADLKEKEDDLLLMRSKLESVSKESAAKDKVQANDSKLIMQLSKKLETLLMDNEDLRDQNDRLNTRLVAVECEKMNLMK
uniref:Uncharacterized protein n=1 Tax=Helicotheca tamesis TaxID=374047 RepID=A0A7S2H2U5_9STRA